MSVLSTDDRVRVAAALIEGNGLRPIERQFKVAKTTILRLIAALGTGCLRLHDRLVRGVAAPLLEADEQWSFCFKKQSRVQVGDPDGWGDIWTWSAECVLTRLIVSFYVGDRSQESASAFVNDLRARITMVPQINTDGLSVYMAAIKAAFDGGRSVDYGTCVKHYSRGGGRTPDYKYEPPREPFVTKHTVFGAPKTEAISTSHVERYHLTARHINGRKRRLCLYFSKKPENHVYSEALSVFAYNFLRVHASLDATPAMAAGLTDHPWTVAEMVTAALAEPETEAPVAQPLTMPETGKTTPARKLPGGGWLRLVTEPAPAHKTPRTPPSPGPAAPPPKTPAVALAPEPAQLDLFAWKPHAKPAPPPPKGQLSLFDMEPPK
jgi:IS1 family transposase